MATTIKYRTVQTSMALVCLATTFVSSCARPAAEENTQPTSVRITFDQPAQPQILDAQKGLPEHIFHADLEAQTLTATQFTKLYGDAVQATVPQSKVVIKSPLNLAVRASPQDQNDCKIDLTKLWQQCKDKPGQRIALATQNLKGFCSLVNFVNQPLAGEEYVDKIVPLLRGKPFLDALTGGKSPQAADLFYEKSLGDLYLVYAVHDLQKIDPLHSDYLEHYARVKKEALKNLSLRNLERIVANSITLKTDGPIYVVSVGGNYEPSLLLLDKVVQKLVTRVKGKLVAAVPTRDSLFICGDETPGALKKLKEATDRALEDSKLPISNKLYILDRGQWKIFQAFDS